MSGVHSPQFSEFKRLPCATFLCSYVDHHWIWLQIWTNDDKDYNLASLVLPFRWGLIPTNFHGLDRVNTFSTRVVNLMLRYLTHAVELNPTWKLIKPHIHDLLTKCIFNLMCFNDEDAELWDTDPQEYIRKVDQSGHTHASKCCDSFWLCFLTAWATTG